MSLQIFDDRGTVVLVGVKEPVGDGQKSHDGEDDNRVVWNPRSANRLCSEWLKKHLTHAGARHGNGRGEAEEDDLDDGRDDHDRVCDPAEGASKLKGTRFRQDHGRPSAQEQQSARDGKGHHLQNDTAVQNGVEGGRGAQIDAAKDEDPEGIDEQAPHGDF